MAKFIIDYTLPTGRKDFKVVEADTAADAVCVFHAAGVDGWTGFNFAGYKIDKIAER